MASEELLRDALRIRLILDNPELLELKSWVGGEWCNHQFSRFYSTESDLDNRIYEMMEEILAAENKKLPQSAANVLRANVTLDMKPPDAIDHLVIAEKKKVAI